MFILIMCCCPAGGAAEWSNGPLHDLSADLVLFWNWTWKWSIHDYNSPLPTSIFSEPGTDGNHETAPDGWCGCHSFNFCVRLCQQVVATPYHTTSLQCHGLHYWWHRVVDIWWSCSSCPSFPLQGHPHIYPWLGSSLYVPSSGHFTTWDHLPGWPSSCFYQPWLQCKVEWTAS